MSKFKLGIFLVFVLSQLSGCMTTGLIPNQYNDNKFEYKYHFTSGSENEARNMAGNYCRNKNSNANLINSKLGCLLFCGTEYSTFSYECVPNQTMAKDIQNTNTNEQQLYNQRLKAEFDEAKRKQEELEQQLRIAQQQTTPLTQSAPVTYLSNKRIALVVGNSTYKSRPLKNSRNDADDISRSLRSSGFEVIDLRDATLPQMRTAVRQFGDRLIKNDVGLVYYSGHGVEVKGRNYFIPVNADIQREDEIADQGLDVSLILEKMSTAGKGVNILIVDACRDDPFGRSFRSSSRGLAQMDAPRGTIIAYATSPGKVASDGDPRERNSPYTKHLVKAMQSPNKPIEQVFKEVRRAVQDETKNQQTPWENTSLSGDFFFKVQK